MTTQKLDTLTSKSKYHNLKSYLINTCHHFSVQLLSLALDDLRQGTRYDLTIKWLNVYSD